MKKTAEQSEFNSRDLVARLRFWSETMAQGDCGAAADEISRLRARVAKLEGALRPFVRLAERELVDGGPLFGEYLKLRRVQIIWEGEHDITPAALRAASATLAGETEQTELERVGRGEAL